LRWLRLPSMGSQSASRPTEADIRRPRPSAAGTSPGTHIVAHGFTLSRDLQLPTGSAEIWHDGDGIAASLSEAEIHVALGLLRCGVDLVFGQNEVGSRSRSCVASPRDGVPPVTGPSFNSSRW
jgi:hypothetical protein